MSAPNPKTTPVKFFARDPHDRERVPVQCHSLTNDFWVRAPFFPARVSQNRRRAVLLLIVARRKKLPERRV